MRVYIVHKYSLQTLMLSVTAGSVNPAAIYHASEIYNLTNNVVFIKYRTKNLLSFIKSHINVCFQNLFYPSSILAAIHLFISSHNEIEDFCSMGKKTGRRYGRRKTFILRHRSYTCILLYFRRWDVTAPLHILSYHT